jgi:arginine deiminase
VKIGSYGTENPGALKKVMLHNPEQSIRRVTSNNLQFYLFDKVPVYDKYIEEHNAYTNFLSQNGVEVYDLDRLIVNNRDLMSFLPNLAYLNDIAVVTSRGAILSTMCPGGRQYEEIVVGEALRTLGIPILLDSQPGEQFEGFIILSPDTLFVAETERFKKESVERFFEFALQYFQNIIYAEVPKARRFMHADMIFNMKSENLGLGFSTSFTKLLAYTEKYS